LSNWKNSFFLITGIGISNVGNWIYLIALNLLVIDMTGSPAAVGGLYIIRPLAILVTNTWAGSFIDRLNSRRIMIIVDCIRGIFIAAIPFVSSIWAVYLLMFFVNIAASFFGPTSNTYITKLVPEENRKRFNSLFSLSSSGAFLLGPSIAGILIMYTSIDMCIFINAISFFICAAFIYILPNVDSIEKNQPKVTRGMLLKDWRVGTDFAKTSKYFMLCFLLFQAAVLMAFALDSQEATFLKKGIHLSEKDYGFLVSIAGVGSIIGSIFATMLVNKLSLRMYIVLGMTGAAFGYTMFYSNSTFLASAVSFLVIGIFFSFANSGYTTFFQNNVPIDIMGRFSSLSNLIIAFIEIIFTLLLGWMAELFQLQFVCFVGSVAMVILSILLCVIIYNPSKGSLYEVETNLNG
jgi:MFS family permease